MVHKCYRKSIYCVKVYITLRDIYILLWRGIPSITVASVYLCEGTGWRCLVCAWWNEACFISNSTFQQAHFIPFLATAVQKIQALLHHRIGLLAHSCAKKKCINRKPLPCCKVFPCPSRWLSVATSRGGLGCDSWLQQSYSMWTQSTNVLAYDTFSAH